MGPHRIVISGHGHLMDGRYSHTTVHCFLPLPLHDAFVPCFPRLLEPSKPSCWCPDCSSLGTFFLSQASHSRDLCCCLGHVYHCTTRSTGVWYTPDSAWAHLSSHATRPREYNKVSVPSSNQTILRTHPGPQAQPTTRPAVCKPSPQPQ